MRPARALAPCQALSWLLAFGVIVPSGAMLPHLDALKDDSVLKVETPSDPADVRTVVKLFVQAEGDGERWDYQLASRIRGHVNELFKLVANIATFFVHAVPVSGLHYHIIGFFEKRRIADDWFSPLANVTGKDQSAGTISVAECQLHAG